MTQKEFDNYKFSINTEIKVLDSWFNVLEVDFINRIITSVVGYPYHLEEIENIRN